MAPRWTESSRKHQIPQADQVWAIAHATYRAELLNASIDDGTVWLYIGKPHAQTDAEIEVLVNVYEDGREAIVFHAMRLGPKFSRYREENPNG